MLSSYTGFMPTLLEEYEVPLLNPFKYMDFTFLPDMEYFKAGK